MIQNIIICYKNLNLLKKGEDGSVRRLKIIDSDGIKITPVLPPNLTYLDLSIFFGRSVSNLEIPPTVKHVIFGSIKYYQDDNIDTKGLIFIHPPWENPTHGFLTRNGLLHWNYHWNHNKLCNLTHLKFGYYFNNILDKGVLPDCLTKLEFGTMFNKSISTDVLPSNLTYLKFGDNFNQPITNNILPDGLSVLIFGNSFNQPIDINALPTSLSVLKFGIHFNSSLGSLFGGQRSLEKKILPSGLTHLTLGHLFDQPLESFLSKSSFPNLTHITLYQYKRQILCDYLPSNLKYLIFDHPYDEYIDKDIIGTRFFDITWIDD